MGMTGFVKGYAAEVTRRTAKDDKSKVYNNLFVYETGSFNPKTDAVRSLSVAPELLEKAKQLVGHQAEIQVEMVEFKGKPTFRFMQGQPAKG